MMTKPRPPSLHGPFTLQCKSSASALWLNLWKLMSDVLYLPHIPLHRPHPLFPPLLQLSFQANLSYLLAYNPNDIDYNLPPSLISMCVCVCHLVQHWQLTRSPTVWSVPRGLLASTFCFSVGYFGFICSVVQLQSLPFQMDILLHTV